MKAAWRRWKYRHAPTAQYVVVLEDLSGQPLSEPETVTFTLTNPEDLTMETFSDVTVTMKQSGLATYIGVYTPPDCGGALIERIDISGHG